MKYSESRADNRNLAEGNTDQESRTSSMESGGGFDERDLQPAFSFSLAKSAKSFDSIAAAYLYYTTLAIKHLESFVKPGVEFNFTPILVAENLSPDILNELPTMVKNYHVKSQVIEGRLFILALSCGPVHGAGVANLLEQMGSWRSGHSTPQLFSSTTDSTYANGHSSAAPDVVLKSNTAYGEDEEQRKLGIFCLLVLLSIFTISNIRCFVAAVIIELEVSNRSVPAIRRDFLSYFLHDDVLHSVIAIKVFNTGEPELEWLYFLFVNFSILSSLQIPALSSVLQSSNGLMKVATSSSSARSMSEFCL